VQRERHDGLAVQIRLRKFLSGSGTLWADSKQQALIKYYPKKQKQPRSAENRRNSSIGAKLRWSKTSKARKRINALKGWETRRQRP